MPNSRNDILGLFAGRPGGRLPVFGGLPSLTAAGLRSAGLRLAAAHTDPGQMAAAAASTFETYGFEAAVVPFDLCVEAEALGAGVDFQDETDVFLAPVVHEPLNVARLGGDWPSLDQLEQGGRVPLVAEAVRRLKAGVGRSVAIGAWIPGPFTLSWQLFGAEGWLTALGPGGPADDWLAAVSSALARVGQLYRAAGADYLTVHEMGGSPQVIGPASFRSHVRPALTRLFAALPAPAVLSVCGDTNAVVEDLVACGAAAINVDQRNHLARTRQIIGRRALLFGNIDPVGVLSEGTPAAVRAAVQGVAASGADAVWPGCDLRPDIPDENFRELMAGAPPV